MAWSGSSGGLGSRKRSLERGSEAPQSLGVGCHPHPLMSKATMPIAGRGREERQ